MDSQTPTMHSGKRLCDKAWLPLSRSRKLEVLRLPLVSKKARVPPRMPPRAYSDWGREFSASQACRQLAASVAHRGIFCGNLLEKLGCLIGQRRHKTLEAYLGVYKGHVGGHKGQYFLGEQVKGCGGGRQVLAKRTGQ